MGQCSDQLHTQSQNIYSKLGLSANLILRTLVRQRCPNSGWSKWLLSEQVQTKLERYWVLLQAQLQKLLDVGHLVVVVVVSPTHFSARSGYFVDDVGEDDVLVVRLDANLLPLRVLPQPDVVAQERVTDATRRKNRWLVGQLVSVQQHQLATDPFQISIRSK